MHSWRLQPLIFFSEIDDLCHTDEGNGRTGFIVSQPLDYQFGNEVCTRLRARALKTSADPLLFSSIFIASRDSVSKSFCSRSTPPAVHFTPHSSYPSMSALTRPPQELHVKILMIGNSSVGKSSLLMRWSENQWLPEDEASPTIGVEVLVSYIRYFHTENNAIVSALAEKQTRS